MPLKPLPEPRTRETLSAGWKQRNFIKTSQEVAGCIRPLRSGEFFCGFFYCITRVFASGLQCLSLVVSDLTACVAAASGVSTRALCTVLLTQNQYDFCYVTVSSASVKIADPLAETLCVSSAGDRHRRKGSQNYDPNLREENRALEIIDFQESIAPTIGDS